MAIQPSDLIGKVIIKQFVVNGAVVPHKGEITEVGVDAKQAPVVSVRYDDGDSETMSVAAARKLLVKGQVATRGDRSLPAPFLQSTSPPLPPPVPLAASEHVAPGSADATDDLNAALRAAQDRVTGLLAILAKAAAEFSALQTAIHVRARSASAPRVIALPLSASAGDDFPLVTQPSSHSIQDGCPSRVPSDEPMAFRVDPKDMALSNARMQYHATLEPGALPVTTLRIRAADGTEWLVRALIDTGCSTPAAAETLRVTNAATGQHANFADVFGSVCLPRTESLCGATSDSTVSHASGVWRVNLEGGVSPPHRCYLLRQSTVPFLLLGSKFLQSV
jgi:hypothetical protein